jgi:hypothetical protein
MTEMPSIKKTKEKEKYLVVMVVAHPLWSNRGVFLSPSLPIFQSF